MLSILASITFQQYILLSIYVCFLVFLLMLSISLFRHRKKIKFYGIIIRDDGRLSKIGVAFIFLMLMLIYQVGNGAEISSYMVELLGIVFATELGRQFISNKYVNGDDTLLDKIKRRIPDKLDEDE